MSAIKKTNVSIITKLLTELVKWQQVVIASEFRRYNNNVIITFNIKDSYAGAIYRKGFDGFTIAIHLKIIYFDFLRNKA